MSKTVAERQQECRQRKRDIVTSQNVTDVTKPEPQDAPQSTNGGGVVVERARLVPIPGDADYVGVCKQVNGVYEPTEVLRRRVKAEAGAVT